MNGRIDLASGFPEGLAITGEPDREEVRRLFREHGEDALPRVHGAFALAAWDESNQRAVLARDALGARPLYYCVSGTQLWFGSRVPKGAPRGQLDRDALSDYLELGYIPSPGTPWSGVRKLPPGHLLRFGKKGVELKRWFEMPVPGSGRPPSRIVVRARLEEAVRRRLAGEPATMLSGGLDSSALVALMTRLSGKVRTYAAGSEEELELARKIATRFRSDHHELRITHRPAEELPALIAEAGEPFADPALLAMAALLREMRGPVLTGDGADELFAGHLRYLRAARIPELRSAASAAELLRKVAPARHRGTLHRAAVTLRTTGAERARAMIEIFTRDERAALLGVAARTARGASAENLTGLDAALAFDFEVSLPDDVMFRLDLAAGGREVRTPFVDVDLAKAVVPPPWQEKLDRLHVRRLLREAVADLLPREVLTRPPRSPSVPVGAWLRGPLRQMLHDLVRAPTARVRTLLDPRAIDRALSQSLAPRGNPRQAWALLCLELWARER
ncbi:MAG TPA: asparagine synthase-related protein [Myxococcales bacterium]|nr:asparagine synthase-related protein [Myxococcales bacterium]